MENKMKNGGPAFPLPKDRHLGDDYKCGMSLRDYFAAKAMSRIPFGEFETRRVAKICYETADAMLKAREK
jgi:hypothetical protein